MAQRVLFLSTSVLKKMTYIGDSVADGLLTPAIYDAQERYILPAMGEALYEAIKTGVATSALTTEEDNLLEVYVIPALAQLSYAEALPNIRTRIVNNSVTIMNSEQSTAASYSDLKPLMSRARELGQFHLERLIDYLDNNQSLFPEMDTESGGQRRRSQRNYNQGLNLDTFPYRSREERLREFAIGRNA